MRIRHWTPQSVVASAVPPVPRSATSLAVARARFSAVPQVRQRELRSRRTDRRRDPRKQSSSRHHGEGAIRTTIIARRVKERRAVVERNERPFLE